MLDAMNVNELADVLEDCSYGKLWDVRLGFLYQFHILLYS